MMKLAPSLCFPLRVAAAIALLFAAGMVAPTALAQHGHDRGHDRGHGHGHGHGHAHAPHFYGPGWHGGHWAHGAYSGRTGWWWVVGPSWYYYPAPVYPYPAPPQAIVGEPLPAPAQYWYYCEPLQGYYPNVSACPTLWQAVPSMPGAVAPAPILQVP
jgi:hypothetical protein